jgi:hypothetical protein
LNGHPLAIGLLSTQHGLKAEVKAEVRSTSPEGLGLEFRFGHATVIMAEWPSRIFQKPENHNILYVPIKKSDEPRRKASQLRHPNDLSACKESAPKGRGFEKSPHRGVKALPPEGAGPGVAPLL